MNIPNFRKFLSLICICSLIFLTGAGAVFAEIKSPYVVEEDAQILFADSMTVSGKNGLENYEYEYVGGYLHITYTYTHHSCCFSSYSPELYITAEDPQTTGTPTVRSSETVFQLLAGTHSTNWYAYDIQFNATGYTVVVTQAGVTEIENSHVSVAGLTDTDYAALANDYDMDLGTAFSMSFTPRLVKESSGSSGGGGSSDSEDSYYTSTRPGDRLRCVDTTEGMYCPTEEVRTYYTIHTIESLIYLLGEMIILLNAEEYNR